MRLPDIIVTNFKKRITGVTTTALRVAGQQKKTSRLSLQLCGPNQELSLLQALIYGWQRPSTQSKRIWHVRRNNEMVWGVIARDLLRQPVKLVFTSAAIRKHSRFPQWLISRMDAVIATSKLAATFVPNVQAIIGHGVDLETFRPDPNRLCEPLKLISVGRVRPEKGTDLIVDVLCEVLPLFPTITTSFVGLVKDADRAFLAQQQDKLERAGVANRVEWLGEIAPDKLPALMSSCHVLLAAPRYEGFGLTPFEAIACGLAIVCTNTGAFADATGVSVLPGEDLSSSVKQGASGFLVQTNNKDALVVALETLLRDQELREAMMKTGPERAKSEFSIEQEAKAIEQVYLNLLKIN